MCYILDVYNIRMAPVYFIKFLVLDHLKFHLHSFLWSSINVLFPVMVGKNEHIPAI